MQKLNITFCSFPDFSGNAKVLFEYMLKKYKNSMNFTWIINDEDNLNIPKKYDSVNAFLIGTEEFRNYITTTDVFFTTHANLAGDKRAAKKAIYVELWHGNGPKPVGFLTLNLRPQDKDWYNFLAETIDYFIAPSEMWRSLYSSMFNINVQRILPLGMPLVDEIKNSDGRKELSRVLDIDVKKYNKVIMYMPTFKKGCGRKLESNYNETRILNFYNYSDDDLIKYLKKNNFLLLVKRHPSDECVYKKIENDFIKNINNEVLSKKGLNVNNILNAADLLITDYSSVGIEFSILDRPVIYISTDVEEYRKNRGIIFDNYSFWTGGVECDNYENMIKLIDKMIGKPYCYENKNFMFNNLNNTNCKKICNYFFENGKLKKNIKRYESEKYILEDEVKSLNEIINHERILYEENKNLCENQKKKMISEIKVLTESKAELDLIKNSRSWKWLMRIKKIFKH